MPTDAIPHKLYNEIENKIRIIASNFSEGEIIGTEVNFASQFHVSRPTVRKAVDRLIAQHVLERVPGKGLRNSIQSTHITKNQKKILIIVDIRKNDTTLFSMIALGAVEIANDLGYNYYIINTENFVKRNATLKDLNLSDYRGAILSAFDTPQDREMIKIIEDAHIPFVLVDNPLEKGAYNYVVADDYGGSFLLSKHLYELGHRKFLYLYGTNQAVTIKNRFNGFADGLSVNNIDIKEDNILRVDDNEKTIEFLENYFRNNGLNCTAIAASNDAIAFSAYRALTNLGYKVPEDISIAGFGGYIDSKFIGIGLTSVKVSGHRIGREAANLLLKNAITNPNQYNKMIIDVTVSEGESCANINAK